MLDSALIQKQVDISLQEDIGSGDITATLIPEYQTMTVSVIAREAGILSGSPWFDMVFHQLDSEITIQWKIKEGANFKEGDTLVILSGNARKLLSGERAALNWLQLLSGIATQTRQYVDALSGTTTQLLDTRKTQPGLRYAQKYAVRCGGGCNHRMGLYDMFLIKENHIAACGGIAAAVEVAKRHHPGKPIEVEVESLEEFQQAVNAGVDRIMLDNFSLEMIKTAVTLKPSSILLEVSGNVSLDNIYELAETRVDYISVGALTKHVKSIDFSMRTIKTGSE